MHMKICWTVNLGLIEYRQALNLQQMLCFKRAYGNIPDILLLLEHPHVYTLGRRADKDHLLINEEEAEGIGADIIAADRGGGITYHGPGQLIAYPILFLGDEPDLHQYLRDLEEVMIQTLGAFGIKARRIPDLTGVWVEDAKIGFIGVKIIRGITKHGFSLNIAPQIRYFEHINPCGLGRPVVSMKQLIDPLPTQEEINNAIIDSFAAVFKQKMVTMDADALDSTKGDLLEHKTN